MRQKGLADFVNESRESAKTAGHILYDELSSAMDKVSDQFAKLFTGQKTDFKGMARGLAEEAHRKMKLLAAQTQRDLMATRNRDAGLTPPQRGRARTPRRGAVPKPRRTITVGWVDEAAHFADGKTGKGRLAP